VQRARQNDKSASTGTALHDALHALATGTRHQTACNALQAQHATHCRHQTACNTLQAMPCTASARRGEGPRCNSCNSDSAPRAMPLISVSICVYLSINLRVSINQPACVYQSTCVCLSINLRVSWFRARVLVCSVCSLCSVCLAASQAPAAKMQKLACRSCHPLFLHPVDGSTLAFNPSWPSIPPQYKHVRARARVH